MAGPTSKQGQAEDHSLHAMTAAQRWFIHAELCDLHCLQIQKAKEDRKKITAHMHQLLGTDGVLMLPSCPGPAPILNTPPEELNLFRARLLSLTCIAGLAGLPQVMHATGSGARQSDNTMCINHDASAPLQTKSAFRANLLSLTCIAGLAGLPLVKRATGCSTKQSGNTMRINHTASAPLQKN